MKASEIFEGENSSLRKTFDEAVANPERTVEEMEDTDDFITDEITTCMEGYRTSVDGIEATYYIDRLTEVINQTLTDERQRCEEMVEAERERIKDKLLFTGYCECEPTRHNEPDAIHRPHCYKYFNSRVLQALTQTNNHK